MQKHSVENLPRQKELPIFVVDYDCSGGIHKTFSEVPLKFPSCK